MGLTKPKLEQIDNLDEETRNRIWNVFYPIVQSPSIDAYLRQVWSNFLKKPTDEIPTQYRGGRTKILYDWLKSIIFKGKYEQIFNLIEFSILFFNL